MAFTARIAVAIMLAPGMSEMRAASGVFFADIASLPAARDMRASHQQARREELAAIIEEGIGSGVFRGVHSRLVAEVLLVAIQRVLDPQVLADNRLAAGDAIGEIEDLLLNGLLNPDAGGRGRSPGRKRARARRARS